MSETAIATISPPTRQALAVEGRSKPLQVTGKLRTAIEYLVFTGAKTDLQAAAQHAGLTTYSLRCALERAHVKAYYRARIEVLRTAEEARTIHRFAEIRDAANNMPAVQAGKELLRRPDDNVNAARGLMPGFAIQIINVQQPAPVAETAKTVLVSD